MSAAHLPLDPVPSAPKPQDLDPASPASPTVIPRDIHESIGNQSAAILESHSQQVSASIDALINSLMAMKEQLSSESHTRRLEIERHTATMRAAEELTLGIHRALKLPHA